MKKPATRLSVVLGVSAILFLAVSTASVSAARGLVTGFTDPVYGSTDPGVRALWLDRTVGANAGLVRMTVPWRAVAPAAPADAANPGSPAYDFRFLDPAVRDARNRGLMVLLTVVGTPDWAEGPGRPASADAGTWKPNVVSLAAFMRAVASRYSGSFDPDGLGPTASLPAIQAIQVWNEPNLPDYLTPQVEGGSALSPDYYRQMLNASYAAIKAVNPGILVVTAGTSPYGGPTSKGARLRPVEFDRDLLCVTAVKAKKRKGKRRKAASKLVRTPGCAAPANFDVLAHHPINTSGPPTQHAFNADDAASADLGRIARVLRGAERAGTVTHGKHPLWATEIWWDSNPPNSIGSPLGRQARWIEQALYLAWRDGASAVINLLVRDSSGDSHGIHDGSGSGLYFIDGRPKPSALAFRFPFVTDRIGGGRLRAWGKAPAPGKLRIQRRARGHWVTARRVTVRRGSVFALKLRLRGKQRLRARVAGFTSLAWKQR
jgi:hypothetical protein